MGTYGLQGVMKAWELEKLTSEQAIGQILQLVAEIEQRVGDLERNYSRMDRMNPLPSLSSRSDREIGPNHAR